MIMGKLKEATREQHENLESIVDVMNKMFNRDDYKTLLTKFYRFYSTVEPLVAINDMKAAGLDLDARRKSHLLEADLNALGSSDEAARIKGTWNGAPTIDTTAKAFGACYVMEGATLGGQVIMRHLKQHLDITPENGGSFFNSYGERVGPMWKEFIAITTAFAETANADDEIVESAKRTFDSFANCFAESATATA